jgi:site-specific DNA-methyltransferase (adenine-specific)
MGKEWDHGVPSVVVWREALRVLKPGAHLLAFGGTRTFHRLTCAIEDAGFEIRDCISWLHGQGFPKSHSFKADDFDGFGTALKPAWEPCIVAMRPMEGTFAQNALEHGVAGLNIDAGRIGMNGEENPSIARRAAAARTGWAPCGGDGFKDRTSVERYTEEHLGEALGRWPANLILDAEAGVMLDAQSGTRKSGAMNVESRTMGYHGGASGAAWNRESSSGGASRFFYCPKASREERNAGLATFRPKMLRGLNWSPRDDGEVKDRTFHQNAHPCVKPVDLCRYLASLLLPPLRTTPRRILVPYSGSGSEMIGALLAGWDEAVGIEDEIDYCTIAEGRLHHWMAVPFDFIPEPENAGPEDFGPLFQ